MNLFIADDEQDVREGIRYLIDWSNLGFRISGEGKNGQDALEQILKSHPDVVLLDIRMPKLSGIEVIKQARQQGFQGKFIILSGYSDFSYAQEAIRYGVTCYLTKPIDEDDLEKAVIEARDSILSEKMTQKRLLQYRGRARESILCDILTGSIGESFIDIHDIMLDASVYQVIIYTNYNQDSFQTVWDFSEILRLANHHHNSLESVKLNNQNVIILKGDTALNRFKDLLRHYISHPQKGSPLDSLFLTYGRDVYSVEQLHDSFDDACLLMNRRFFCQNNQHVLGYTDLPKMSSSEDISLVDIYSQRISDFIQSGNRYMLEHVLEELKGDIYVANTNIPSLKHFLADIMIQVKFIITRTYGYMDIPFPHNTAILNTIEEKYYLYEILQLFLTQFDMCMNAIGSPTSESIMDNILHYINHNYKENLKLNTIAKIFGYNSSYLGKVFSRCTGKNFNTYVDEIRIENSKKLLLNHEYKVYEIAQLVGYTNVDYFHKKFKKFVGISPAEYRKIHLKT